jgi:hypothetical protein
MTLDDVASSDRQRLDLLLGVGRDPHLEVAPPEPFSGEGKVDWAAGFEDPERAVRLTVWFVRDPAERDAAAARLAGTGGLVGTNGGMLFHGYAQAVDPAGESRLTELASRFAGEE